MRVLCLGAGAVGGYYGGRLLEGGCDVSFLVRPARRAQLEAHGLVIESPSCGNYVASRAAVIDRRELADAEAFDVVLLTCKAYDLQEAMDAIAPAVARKATVLPLLNGLAHLDLLNRRFGRSNVLGGLAKIAATLTAEGVVRHLNDWRFITFGEQDGAMSARVVALKAAFDRTSVLAGAVPDVLARMWEKFVHLATVASMTCLMRASVGEIARTPSGTRQLLDVFDALSTLAAGAGHPVSEAFQAEYRRLFQDGTSTYTASMLRDLERGGRVEADHIVGYAVAAAAANGMAVPLLEAAYTHLKAYEERRAAGRL